MPCRSGNCALPSRPGRPQGTPGNGRLFISRRTLSLPSAAGGFPSGFLRHAPAGCRRKSGSCIRSRIPPFRQRCPSGSFILCLLPYLPRHRPRPASGTQGRRLPAGGAETLPGTLSAAFRSRKPALPAGPPSYRKMDRLSDHASLSVFPVLAHHPGCQCSFRPAFFHLFANGSLSVARPFVSRLSARRCGPACERHLRDHRPGDLRHASAHGHFLSSVYPA